MFNWLKKSAGPDGGRVVRSDRLADCARVMSIATQAISVGDLAVAAHCYEDGLLIYPDDLQLRVGLGSVLFQKACYAEARIHLNRAILLDPANAGVYYLLGQIAQKQGAIAGAIDLYTEALEINPELDDVYGNLTTVLLASGRKEVAESMLLKALSERPQSAQLQFVLGTLYDRSGAPDKAERCYRTSLTINPSSCEAHTNLGAILQQNGHLEAAIESFERALELNGEHLATRSNLLWLRSFQSAREAGSYIAEARQYGEMVLARARACKDWLPGESVKANRSALRVGFVSGDLRMHPVGFFLEGVLAHINLTKFELVAYSMNPKDDLLTERIKTFFSEWTPIAQMSDEEAAHKIRSDGVDILIDLAGHTAHNRLAVFAWKPAPVQVSWLGYLASTGVPGIDYLLADSVSVPATADEQFSEEIWRLPETFNCFTPPPEHPKLAVALPPALRNGWVSFGSFQRVDKLTDHTLALWGRTLNALPQGRLCLRNQDINSDRVRARLLERLNRAGITSDRIVLRGPIPDRNAFLASYADVDIALDTTRYLGTTTTCEALWMGVPTVTLAGETMLTRVGASLLTCAGLSDWVARSEEEYVALAVKHGSDVEALVRLRAGLRQKIAITPLFNAARFVPQLEDALMAMWQRKAPC